MHRGELPHAEGFADAAIEDGEPPKHKPLFSIEFKALLELPITIIDVYMKVKMTHVPIHEVQQSQEAPRAMRI